MATTASKLWRMAIWVALVSLAIAAYASRPVAANYANPGSGEQTWRQSEVSGQVEQSEFEAVSRSRTREILVDFFHATGGENWANNTNWLSDKPVRSWYGVTATGSGTVEKLILQNNGLAGEVPPALGELDSLRLIDLGLNQLTGAIPPELGNLSLMYHLHLGSNQLTGTIPPQLAEIPKLESLDLFDNNLVGQIPPELGTPPRFHLLRLDGNLLTGPIPSTLGQLARLKYLRLDNNNLSGAIPAEIGNLVRLDALEMDDNHLTGPIPPEIGNLTRLRTLKLGRNQLTGSLPPELGNITRMYEFTVNGNSLSGPIPPQLHAWNGLRWVWLRGNQLSGCLPAHWDDLEIDDFEFTELGFCAFGLAHLDANPGSLEPAYSPSVEEFTLRVGLDAEEFTLRAFFGPAMVAIKDARGLIAQDTDPVLAGHQIKLPARATNSSYSIEYNQDSRTMTYIVNVVRRFQGRISVLDNRFVQAPGNDDLKHNIPNLEVEVDGETFIAGFLSHYDLTGGERDGVFLHPKCWCWSQIA